ncbi:PHP domain-containing protein [Irregularibacter muris]|uniref:PHP domain-containing protein n=1 Tax=Irregularibacter muris TaxID=1796619 RepID=A0AAE3HEQ6_9FIRM|nr:PHP domain-containing protein [Irregularibacter muris]MCR1899142.1 PHP domain-containing protein [Irregularibacter muris]
MKIIADYHTHTKYSHGKGTIIENVLAAKKKGLKKVVISDHGPNHIGFGVKIKKFLKMRQEIDEINDKIEDIEVLMGIESNIVGIDGTIDVPEKYLDLFDILLAGFHYGVRPKSFKDLYYLTILNGWEKISRTKIKRVREINTHAAIKAIERYPIQIITHPGAKIPIDTDKLSRAAAKKGTWLEINASHGYLTKEYIHIAKGNHAMFVINSDAHTPERVGDFERAIHIAREAGLEAKDIINAQKGD